MILPLFSNKKEYSLQCSRLISFAEGTRGEGNKATALEARIRKNNVHVKLQPRMQALVTSRLDPIVDSGIRGISVGKGYVFYKCELLYVYISLEK